MDTTELVKDLQEMRESGHLSDPILRRAVRDLSGEDHFDWVGVYLMDEEKNRLWLHNYVGEPTEHAVIEVGQGVCGIAVEKGENANVPDVSEVEDYLVCSPDTQSELVVLIRAGDSVLGQIDIDSDRKAAFSEEDEQQVQLVADKLAEVLMAERRQ
ncbi:MAG: GAF domain-containing protein [Gemmatimonadota bacterium]|jgi:L-methionine (R)-S-oxide reductase